ncbi:hypothetical protein P3S68_004437 [Capsicum galapagoense]
MPSTPSMEEINSAPDVVIDGVKSKKKMGSASLKEMVGPSKRKAVEKIKRDILQKGTHYIVKEVPPHSLKFDSSCNAKILKDFKEILKDEGWSCLVI